jgi:hypothetical protein
MGINPNNKITIIIRMLFAVTLFQQNLRRRRRSDRRIEHCERSGPWEFTSRQL